LRRWLPPYFAMLTLPYALPGAGQPCR